MSEVPSERPAQRHIDLASADVPTLVDLGALDPHPAPPTSSTPPPVEDPPTT
ncbi:hypothetical protein ACH41E_30170 [Streptomyces sp. NPDC020412]|uniref:hypothetical protein n=1 Tax=Streptomyces sp. NPDC020412 TaxID=3365073 RepID=UPI0037AB91A9